MNHRAFLLYGALFLLLVAVQIGIFIHRQRPLRSSIECRATNAGLPLEPEHGRVFVYQASHPDQLTAEGHLQEALDVPPGDYHVRVLHACSQDQESTWIENVAVSAGERIVQEVAFSAGELSVEALVGTESATARRVVVYVFKPEDHDQVVTSTESGRRVLITAGSYDLRVVLTVDSEEKDVRWLHEVEVKAAVHTRREVAFQRGALSVKGTNVGEPLPLGAVALTVYRAGDMQHEIVDEGLAGVPLGLAVGTYDVKVTYTDSNDQPSRWLRALELKDNEALEQNVDFSSGTLNIGAEIENGDPLGVFQVYVYYYDPGDHEQPVTYTPAGKPVVLESGRYDVRAHFFRSHDQPDIWLREITLPPGQVVTKTVRFPSGKLLVRAYDAAGTELIGDNVFLHVYATGQRQRPVAVGRSGEILVLTEGEYDIRIEDTRGPARARWLGDVRLRSGELHEKSVTLGKHE